MINTNAPRKVFLPLLGLSFFAAQATASTITCLSNPGLTTIRALVNCFHAYTVPHDTYTKPTYDAAQPTSDERTAWVQAVTDLMNVDGNCASLTVPALIQDYYTIGLFTESGGKSYCVLAETTTIGSYYTRGWGLVAVPATSAAVTQNLHFSAPHPQADLHTPQQAASLFGDTGAKSLLIAGRNRTAYFTGDDAISGCNSDYKKTDPAHDNTQPFFDAAVAIRNWQNSHGGCPAATCAYIQIHGKGTNTCASDDIFLSAGLGNSASSVAWYTDPSADRPVRRLRDTLRAVFPTWTISMPSDSSCSLTATQNIFGRLLNGIALANVCTSSATASTATGQFIHAEQDMEAREQPSEDEWITAINNAF